MTSAIDGMSFYVKQQQIKYRRYKAVENVKKILADTLEFNPVKRANCRIVRFVKRHYFFTPINMSPEEIALIPPIRRFRCYVYDSDEVAMIRGTYDTFIAEQSGGDKEIEKVIRMSMEDDINRQIEFLLHASPKIPIMVDLQTYGPNPYGFVSYDAKIRTFDMKTRNRIIKNWDKINSEMKVERMHQLIAWSRHLAQFYLLNSSFL